MKDVKFVAGLKYFFPKYLKSSYKSFRETPLWLA